jgi:hypothetical protein
MTRTTPRTAAPRVLTALIPTLLVVAVAIGFVGATQAPGASAGGESGSPSVPTAVKANPDCLTDDLTGTVIGQPHRPRSSVRDAVLRLTNTSGRTCQVHGWPDIAMVTPPGELVPVPTHKVDQVGANAEIILKPQASAWSRVQWDNCDAGREGCGVGVALQYIVDPDSTGAVAELTAVPEADRAGITMKAMRVSPLQHLIPR